MNQKYNLNLAKVEMVLYPLEEKNLYQEEAQTEEMAEREGM